jgi:beta-phosphoglucomutase-like phosphatase (HAD superfamily)
MAPLEGTPPPRPGAVICDLDGTLVDTVPTRIDAWLRTFAEFGIEADRNHVASLIGSDGKWLAGQVAERKGGVLALDRAEAIDHRAGAIYGDMNTDPCPLPGVAGFLAALAEAGVPWAIATSSRPEQVRASVTALGLDPWPTVIDGLAVDQAKPEPDLLFAAAERLEVAPATCWCVGDSRWDVLAAIAAGMAPVAVATGASTAAELTEFGAATVVERLDQLIPYLAA